MSVLPLLFTLKKARLRCGGPGLVLGALREQLGVQRPGVGDRNSEPVRRRPDRARDVYEQAKGIVFSEPQVDDGV